MKLIAGHWYRFNDRGEIHTGQYMGRERGFECCVCFKGENCHCFNVWYSSDGWETWGYGNSHLPEILEDLGAAEEIIIDRAA